MLLDDFLAVVLNLGEILYVQKRYTVLTLIHQNTAFTYTRKSSQVVI